MKQKETFKYKLLVEGNNDQHVIWALCESNKLDNNFDVIDCGNVSLEIAILLIHFVLSDIMLKVFLSAAG